MTMTEPRPHQPAGSEPATEVSPEEWPAWCKKASADLSGHELDLYFTDPALGDVRLAEDQPLVAIEHDELGPNTAFTIVYGDGVVPMRHVIADPRVVMQQCDRDGVIRSATITDATGRRTFVGLA
jgi:hypothetical protein